MRGNIPVETPLMDPRAHLVDGAIYLDVFLPGQGLKSVALSRDQHAFLLADLLRIAACLVSEIRPP